VYHRRKARRKGFRVARLDDLTDRGPRGIAGAIARQIRQGELSPGDRLPTVRDVAAQLGVSPATVSAVSIHI
jgi:MOSC domain-containing protein YiiM